MCGCGCATTLRRLVVATFGAAYSYFLVRLLYGRRWSDDTDAAGASTAEDLV